MQRRVFVRARPACDAGANGLAKKTVVPRDERLGIARTFGRADSPPRAGPRHQIADDPGHPCLWSVVPLNGVLEIAMMF